MLSTEDAKMDKNMSPAFDEHLTERKKFKDKTPSNLAPPLSPNAQLQANMHRCADWGGHHI